MPEQSIYNIPALDNFSSGGLDVSFCMLMEHAETNNRILDLSSVKIEGAETSNVTGVMDKKLLEWAGDVSEFGAATGIGVLGAPGQHSSTIHGTLENTSSRSNLMSVFDVNPHIVETVAASSMNNHISHMAGNSLDETEWQPLSVTPEVFEPPHDDFYNLALQMTSRMDDQFAREGKFERLLGLAETQAADKSANAPGLLFRMRDIENGEFGDLTSEEKLDKLEEVAERLGYFNPRGDGQLHYSDNGQVIRDPSVVATERAEMEAFRDATPLEREILQGDVVDGYASLSMHEAKRQFSYDVRDLMADPNTSEGAKELFSDPRVLENTLKTIEECRMYGGESIDIKNFELDTPEGRATGMLRAVHKMPKGIDCAPWRQVNQSLKNVTENHGAETERQEEYSADVNDIGADPF